MDILILKIIKRILQMLLPFFQIIRVCFKKNRSENIGFQSGYQVLNVFPKMFPIALHFLIPGGDVDPHAGLGR
jgi:hypothetical protein